MLDHPVFTHTDLVRNNKYFRLAKKIQAHLDLVSRIRIADYTDLPDAEFYHDHFCLNMDYESFYRKCEYYIKRLDIYITTTNTNDSRYEKIYNFVKKFPKLSDYPKLKEFLSFKCSTESDFNWFMQILSDSSKLASVRSLESRLYFQVSHALKNDWAVVFSTLTVNPEHYDDVFKKGSDHWRNYVRSVQRSVAKECYGSWRKAKGKEYFEYFAVVEEGEETGRLHLHVLFFMKDLPYGCYDPNKGSIFPFRREISELKGYWYYGNSTHVAVRFGNNDYYGRRNWVWPVDKDTGDSIDISIPEKLTKYIIKYVLKTKRTELISNTESEVKLWRSRMTRTLGKVELIQVINQMTELELMSLVATKVPPKTIQVNSKAIPFRLIRQIAVKALYKLKERNLLPNVCKKTTHIKQLSKITILKTTTPNSQNFMNFIHQIMQNMGDFEGYHESLYGAISKIESAFGNYDLVPLTSKGGEKTY